MMILVELPVSRRSSPARSSSRSLLARHLEHREFDWLRSKLLSKQKSSRVIHKEVFNVSIAGSHLFEFWDDVAMHVKKLIGIGLLKLVFLGNGPIREFLVNVNANAIV